MLRSLRDRVRRQFTYEGTWRLFLVLTALGLVGIVYMALSAGEWSYEWHITSLVDSRHWRLDRSGENYIVLALLFGPFLAAKAIDWIVAGIGKGG